MHRQKGSAKIEYDNYRLSVKEWIYTLLGGVGAGLMAVWICYDTPRALPLIIPVCIMVFRLRKKQLRDGRILVLEAHFREFLSALYTNLAAGYALENCVKLARQDMEKLFGSQDPLVRELVSICRELSLQVPVEKLFYEFGIRSCSEDIRSFGEVLMIVKRTGGNMDRVLKTCRSTISGRIDTRQEIETLIAAKRYEQRLMSLMPVGIIFYLRVSFGSFMDCLYGSLTGALIMTAALGVYGAAFFLGIRMVRIEV